MRKFSHAIPALHEAEGAAKSELQKSYAEYFKAKLNKFGAKSPADLTPEQKTEFFNEITKDWTRGEGATKAGQADVEEHGVKESLGLNESAMGDVHIMAQEAKNFAEFKKQFVKEFKVEGKDNNKDLDSWLKQVHDSAMEEMKESTVNEASKVMYDLPVLDWQRKYFDKLNDLYFSYLTNYSKTKSDKIGNLSSSQLHDMYGEEITSKLGISKYSKYAEIATALIKAGLVQESTVNEGKEVELTFDSKTNRKSELEEFKSQIHNTIDKSIKIDINGQHNSILIRTDAKFASKIEDLAKSFEIENVSESVINEAEVKSEAEFKEYAMALLKKAHPDDFDEEKANATVEGILKKCDGDFGAAVGMITSSLGESATNEKKDGITPEEMARIQQLKKLKDLKANEGDECPMCKSNPCECYTNEGNAFGDAVKKAKDAGEKEFEFQGKTYKVEESEAGAPNDLNEGADVTPYLDEVKKALPQLEDLIKKKLGFAPKLTADKKGADRIFIQSSDLMNELGKTLVKTLFTKIEIGFWGGNVTSDGKSIWFNPKIWYEHPSGGSNGADFVWDSLWWDLASKKWVEGRSLIK